MALQVYERWKEVTYTKHMSQTPFAQIVSRWADSYDAFYRWGRRQGKSKHQMMSLWVRSSAVHSLRSSFAQDKYFFMIKLRTLCGVWSGIALTNWGDSWRWTCELQELAGGAIQGRTGVNVSLSGFMVLFSPDVIRCGVGQKCTGAGHQNYHTQPQMQFHLQQDIQKPKLVKDWVSSEFGGSYCLLKIYNLLIAYLIRLSIMAVLK